MLLHQQKNNSWKRINLVKIGKAVIKKKKYYQIFGSNYRKKFKLVRMYINYKNKIA